ncbi:uncharacterized protein LOC124553330 [Schistocerca americana]|uniref:uncharacterized protein LOC124553330 n=1 Tax=Schistocerca americana TaxID=7009 RepID=UPI001F4F7A05|nr:uncharacterized protein LOC124553330 [Schistocerca americana]
MPGVVIHGPAWTGDLKSPGKAPTGCRSSLERPAACSPAASRPAWSLLSSPALPALTPTPPSPAWSAARRLGDRLRHSGLRPPPAGGALEGGGCAGALAQIRRLSKRESFELVVELDCRIADDCIHSRCGNHTSDQQLHGWIKDMERVKDMLHTKLTGWVQDLQFASKQVEHYEVEEDKDRPGHVIIRTLTGVYDGGDEATVVVGVVGSSGSGSGGGGGAGRGLGLATVSATEPAAEAAGEGVDGGAGGGDGGGAFDGGSGGGAARLRLSVSGEAMKTTTKGGR